MSYQIFALKWRPQNFDEVVGQNHVVNLLKNSIQRGRLAYSYLFAGPRGVGKTSTARILAKSLNCEKAATVTPCQICVSCQEITQCRSLDVIEIDGASNRGIDEIRVLRESVKFSPTVGRFKIYIIDEVHMLTNEAFNALLKTLEEPPKFVKFIFATTEINKIPSTILSRCQRMDFRRIPLSEIISQLKKIAFEEKINLEEEVFYSVGRACDGSLRDAESILDQLISFSQKGNISISDVSSLLGVLEQELLFDITDKIIKKDASGVLKLLNDMLRQGKDNKIILNNMIEHFRNLIVVRVTEEDTDIVNLPVDIIKKLFVQSRQFSFQEMFNIFNLLVDTQEMSKKMDSSLIPLEIGLVRMTQDKEAVVSTGADGSDAEKNVKLKNISENNKTQVKKCDEKHNLPEVQSIRDIKAEETGLSEGRELIEADIKEIWHKVIESLSKIKMSLATYLSEGTPLKLEKGVLTISFPSNCSLHKDTLEKKENKKLVEKVFSESCQRSIRFEFVIAVSRLEKEQIKVEQKKNEEEKKKNDAVIHSALNAFNARFL